MKAFKKENPAARVLRKFFDIAEVIEEHFITLFTLIMGFIMIVNVVQRAIGLQGFVWVEESSRYMLVVTTLIGCSIAVKHKGHMVMDAVVTAVPRRVGQAMRALGYLICGVIYIYLAYYGWLWMQKLIAMKRMWESISVPLWPIWILVVYAVGTMGLRYIVQFVKSFIAMIKGEKLMSEQDVEIEKAMAEEAERQRAIEGGKDGDVK